MSRNIRPAQQGNLLCRFLSAGFGCAFAVKKDAAGQVAVPLCLFGDKGKQHLLWKKQADEVARRGAAACLAPGSGAVEREKQMKNGSEIDEFDILKPVADFAPNLIRFSAFKRFSLKFLYIFTPAAAICQYIFLLFL